MGSSDVAPTAADTKPTAGRPVISRLKRAASRAVVDVAPLRQVPGYRWLFAGKFVTLAGRELAVVAVPLQIYQLTGSTLAVGLLGLAQLVPLVAVSFIGGALADSIDRRKLIVFAQVVLAVTGLFLLWNSVSETPAIWPLYVLSGINAGAFAVDSPARIAIVPGLVGRTLLPSALALNQTQMNLAKAAVPAVGGFLIAASGHPVAYATMTVSFLVGALLVSRVPEVEVEGGGREFSVASIKEGLSFLKSKRLIQAALLIDLNAMVFGMPSALFPAFGTETLGGDAWTVGLLYAAPGAGALIGALTSGWVSHVVRQGRAVVIAVISWGLAIAVFGLSRSTYLAVAMLALAGAADVVSAIFRQAVVQLSVPDSLRGRLSGVHMAVTAGGPRLGDLEAGVVASLTNVRFSVVSGGVACVIGALGIAKWSKEFMGYEYRPADVADESAQA